MNCPHCWTPLTNKNYKGISVDKCAKCSGMWLDAGELRELEDKAFYDGDDLKGTLVFSTLSSERACPHCGEKMKRFRYRLYDLELEMCGENHGYWLDKDEEARVLQLMEKEGKALRDKLEAEKKWTALLKRLRTPSFLDKVKAMMKRKPKPKSKTQ